MGKPIIWSGTNAKLINSGDLIDRDNLSLTNGSKITVTQASHGFTSSDVGCPLYLNGSTWTKARADAASTADVAGFIYSVIDSNTLRISTNGQCPTVGANFLDGGGSLVAGTVYYLSATTAGKVTATEPTASGYVSKPLGVATNTTSFLFSNFRGLVNGGGSTLGTVPVGTIVAYNPGYYTNASNGSFTVVGPTANTEAAVNTFLNSSGWYVCDGAAVNNPSSSIWNAANRYLPDLNDSRFIMGSTTAGTPAGANTADISHTHSVTSNVSISNHTLTAANIPTVSTNYTPAGTIDISHTHGTSSVTLAKNEFNTNQSGHAHAPGNTSGLFVTSGTGGSAANVTTGGGGYVLNNTDSRTASWSATNANGTAGGQSLGSTGKTLLGSSATISVGSATPTAITHTVTNNAVTSGTSSVTSINTIPLYLSSFYIIRVF